MSRTAIRRWTGAMLLVAGALGARGQNMVCDTVSTGVVACRDGRLDSLIQVQAAYNGRINLARKLSKGFRIQIINTMDRAKATDAKARVLELFPDQKVYLYYQEPYFKVRFGNFRTTEEAQEYEDKLQKIFPGAFIIPSPIEPKPEWFNEAPGGTM